MMRKGEVGQAFIWVLIMLTVGALILVPGLGLAYSGLKASQIATRNVKSLYLAEAAQEKILWELSYNNLGSQLLNSGDNVTVTVEICGNSAEVLVVMRAVETQGAVVFATEHVIRPTITVYPDIVSKTYNQGHTYTIRLEQLSNDTSQGLDAIYHMLPRGFRESDYELGSSRIRYGNGPWESIADPGFETSGIFEVMLKWPATYNYETGEGGFTSPFRDFQVREVRELEFTMNGGLGGKDGDTYPSWVVLKPWDTLSGAAGLISINYQPDPLVMQDGMIQSQATTIPEVIEPNQYTAVEYTIHMTNYDDETLGIDEVRIWLPPDFTYDLETAPSGITDSEPLWSIENLNGLDRWFLNWTDDELPPVSIQSGETGTLTFMTFADISTSGDYFAEVMVFTGKPPPLLLRNIGVLEEEYITNYTWNTGGIVVPHYDSQATAGEVVIDSNIGWGSGVLKILSWHLE